MYDMSFHHRSLSRSGYAGNFNSPTHDLPPLITKLLKNSRFTDTRWNPANNLAQKGFCVKAESELSTLLSLSAERSLFPSKFLNISSRALHKVVVSKTAYDRRFYYYSFRGSRVILDKTSLMRRGRDSNPGRGFPLNTLAVCCFQPLSHLSNFHMFSNNHPQSLYTSAHTAFEEQLKIKPRPGKRHMCIERVYHCQTPSGKARTRHQSGTPQRGTSPCTKARSMLHSQQ